MIIDSNIIIYAFRPEHAYLRLLIQEHGPAISAISYVETLGYHRLNENERRYLENLFASTLILPITQPILDQAVYLRQQRRMSLGDALIAATSMVHGLTLVTRNLEDFNWIDGLALLNPLQGKPD